MNPKFKEILGKTDDVIFRYPMVLTMALIASVSAIAFFESEGIKNGSNFEIAKIVIIALLGISLMFGIKMLSQRIGKQLILEILGIIFLFAFYFVFPENEKNFTEMYAFIVFPTFLLSHLFVSFSAFLNNNQELNFWQFNKNLFINAFLTAVFTGVLVGGIMLAILAVDKLFDFNFNNKLYGDTFYFLAIFGSCFIFLLFNEKGLFYLEKDGNYPLILKFFTQFVLIPLLMIYAVILYLYSVKILLKWELPRGWVSYLILAYSIVGIFALLLVYPLKEISAKSWVKIFSKIFYYTLIPLLILLFVAIFTRILEYGYTEPRYFVLLLALWLTSVVICFVFYKKFSIKFIPISLFVFGVFALVFPYYNAFSVSKRSQKNELTKILTENNLLENGKINFQKQVKDSVVTEIADKYQFLNERSEKAFLLNFIPENQQIKFKEIFEKDIYLVNSEMRNQFKNIKLTNVNFTENFISIYRAKNLIEINDYEKLIVFERENGKFDFNGQKFEISKNNRLQVIMNNSSKFDLQPFLEKIIRENQGKIQPVYLDDISTEFDLGNTHFKIYIDFINVARQNKSENIFADRGIILMRKK